MTKAWGILLVVEKKEELASRIWPAMVEEEARDRRWLCENVRTPPPGARDGDRKVVMPWVIGIDRR